jgi:hypothetical protein
VQQILIGNQNAERDLILCKIALFVTDETNKQKFTEIHFLYKYYHRVMDDSLHGTCWLGK